MATGDLKGEETMAIKVTAGEEIIKGVVVHFESDGYFDMAVENDQAKFGVALEAASEEGKDFMAVVWGRVEVSNNVDAIDIGELVEASANGTIKPAAFDMSGNAIGTAWEDIAASENGTIWVGLVR